MNFPKRVKIVEVSPRDGLQDMPLPVIPTHIKIELINRLAESGLQNIEATSYVSPKWVPQLADCSEVVKGIFHKPGLSISALVPNVTGFKKTIADGVNEITIFASATETFSLKNLNCPVSESLQKFHAVITRALESDIPVRGAISVALGCPYEGKVDPVKVANLSHELYRMGCHEIVLCDTIGVGTPVDVLALVHEVSRFVPVENFAMHFHDTFGQAVANIYASLGFGIGTFDTSVAGLGGCPFTGGSAGHVATEDVLYLLNGLGIETAIDLDKIIETGRWIASKLGIQNNSRTGNAPDEFCQRFN